MNIELKKDFSRILKEEFERIDNLSNYKYSFNDLSLNKQDIHLVMDNLVLDTITNECLSNIKEYGFKVTSLEGDLILEHDWFCRALDFIPVDLFPKYVNGSVRISNAYLDLTKPFIDVRIDITNDLFIQYTNHHHYKIGNVQDDIHIQSNEYLRRLDFYYPPRHLFLYNNPNLSNINFLYDVRIDINTKVYIDDMFEQSNNRAFLILREQFGEENIIVNKHYSEVDYIFYSLNHNITKEFLAEYAVFKYLQTLEMNNLPLFNVYSSEQFLYNLLALIVKKSCVFNNKYYNNLLDVFDNFVYREGIKEIDTRFYSDNIKKSKIGIKIYAGLKPNAYNNRIYYIYISYIDKAINHLILDGLTNENKINSYIDKWIDGIKDGRKTFNIRDEYFFKKI